MWRTRKDKARPETRGREELKGLVEAGGPMSEWRKCWEGKAGQAGSKDVKERLFPKESPELQRLSCWRRALWS